MNRSEYVSMTPSDRLAAFVGGCRLAMLLGFAMVAGAAGMPREWTLIEDGETRAVTAVYDGLRGDRVRLLTDAEPPAALEVAFTELSRGDRETVLAEEDTQQPRAAPAWLPGYRIRFAVRVIDDLLTADARSIMVRLPTGGWARDDAADLVAQGADGSRLPVAVLSHDLRGDTLIQFRRQGVDRWYWVYLVHPDPPRLDADLQTRIDRLRSAYDTAVQRQMALQKQVGEAAGRVRDLDETIRRALDTAGSAEREIEQWKPLLPQREAAVRAADEPVAPARDAVAAAETGAREARAAADQAVAAQRAAEQRATAAGDRVAAMAADDAERPAAMQAADESRAAATQAAEAALRARMAAAGADTALNQARDRLNHLQKTAQDARAALQQGRQAEQGARRLLAEQQTIARDTETPRDRARQNLEQARQDAGAAVETADRYRLEYFEAAADADPRLLQEGLTAEFRQWEGDQLSSWPAVVDGLQRSDNVLGNAFLPEIRVNVNPTRRHDPRNFAASYRGYLNAEKEGVYSFFANSDDASFIFINGFLVHARPGANRPMTGRIPVFTLGADIALEAGVHPIEVHHVVGNSPEAIGFCGLMWLTPDNQRWQYVPRQAFQAALTALPAGVERSDGQPVAVILHGQHDTLVSDGVAMFPVRFTAAGGEAGIPDANLRWDFGDGITATGRAPEHVYFEPGDYLIRLSGADGLPPFTRRIDIGTVPVPTSPLTLARTVETLAAMELETLPVARLNQAFNFLRLCEQENRWPVMERVCRRLLELPDLDLQYRAQLHGVLMEAMARQGRGHDALRRLDDALSEVAGLQALEAELLLKAADVHRIHLRDHREADRLYSRILEQYHRLRHPVMRRAAVAWGDLFLQAGDVARAAETYRLAAGFGEDAGVGESAIAAAGRGALLRVAEQQVRAGNLGQARRLLERIENQFPEQKVEGLYRFLRGEAGRLAGRYEEALYDYEVVLQLGAWAGFHGPAMIGTADVYRRMGDEPRALEWLDSVKERYPELFQQRALQTTRDLIAERIDRHHADGPWPRFDGFQTAFTPDPDGTEAARFTAAQRVRLATALTLDGSAAALIHAGDQARAARWQTVLNHVDPESRFLVEFWFRDEFASARAIAGTHVQIDLLGPDGRRAARETVPIQGTFGQWHKVSAILTGPAAETVTVVFNFANLTGIVMLDGVDIRVVSDRQHDALRRFIEGEGDGL